jgi:ATP-binding cassette subfamily B protein RaxB
MLPPPPLRVEGLTFNYGAGEAPILKDLNFEIPAGAFVALVGASGAGKTTLMRILLGLLPPTGGRVIADGVPLGPTSIAAWRGRVAAVLQDDLLLAGTLADNIAFFDPHFDEKRVMHVSRLAWIHGEIMRMPMGYQSLIGDMGAALSAGQRQRILLARALYRDPDMLFLDEGTANLDERTEQRIVDVIASLPVTRFVIAHRPALVERADIVLTLRDGSIEDVQSRSPRRESRRSDPRLTATAPGKANAPYR